MGKDKKPFLVIGTFKNAKIVNELQLTGRQIISKNLTSSPSNWDTIISELKKKDTYHNVILSLSESVLLIAQCDGYIEKFKIILELLADLPHVIFIYESNLFGEYNIFCKDFYTKYLYYDKYYENKLLYIESKEKLKNGLLEIGAIIAGDYLLEVLLPAAILADEEQWNMLWRKSMWSINNHCFIGQKQMNLDEIFPGVEIQEEDLPFGDDFERDYLNYLQEEKNPYIEIIRRNLHISQDIQQAFLTKNLGEKRNWFASMLDLIDEELLGRQTTLWDEQFDKTKDAIKKTLLSDEFILNLKPDNEWRTYRYYFNEKVIEKNQDVNLAKNKMDMLIKSIQDLKLNICSFKYSNDEVLAIRQIVEDEEDRIVFKRYILKDRIFADELERFLTLFKDYLSQIKKMDIIFEEHQADIGTVYVLRTSDKAIESEQVAEYGIEFLKLLEICDSDLDEARRILREMDCSNIDYYLQKYIKEVARLKIDIRHDYEKRLLEIRQSMEKEIIEEKTNEQVKLMFPPAKVLIEKEVNDSFYQVMDLDYLQDSRLKMIYGDPKLNEKDELLWKYMKILGAENLSSDLQIIKDQKTKLEERKKSGTRIKRFLSQNANKIGSLDFEECKNYIEEMMK